MKNKCLYCYELLSDEQDYHEKCSRSFFGTKKPPHIPYTFEQMDRLAKEVIERSITVPGVQPKLSMSLDIVGNQSDTRLTVIGALGGEYIFKPPSVNYNQIPENEHLTMRIAESFGIRVVQSSLVRLASGEFSYITKRIDRTGKGEKIHMLDMFQITEAFDKYKGSMEKVGNALHRYSNNTLLDKILYFELSVFCFLTGNNDMHLKNFSMIETPSGWSLSPAYDLLNVALLLPEDTDELALTIGGKRKKLKREHFQKFGEDMGLTAKQIDGVFKRMLKKRTKAEELINKSYLTEEAKKEYKSILFERYDRLYN